MRLSHCFCLCLIVLPPYSSIQFIFIPTMSLFRSPWCPRDRLNQLWDLRRARARHCEWPGAGVECNNVTLWPVTGPRPGPASAPAPVSVFWLFHGAGAAHHPLSLSLSPTSLYFSFKAKIEPKTSETQTFVFLLIHESVNQCWIFVKIWVHWHCREHDRGHSLEWFCTRYFCASLWMFSGVQDIVTLLTKYFGASRGIVS